MKRRSVLQGLSSLLAPWGINSYAQLTPAVRGEITTRTQTERVNAPGLNPFLQPARSTFAWAATNDRIYILGGHVGEYHDYPSVHFTPDFLEFDLRQRSWRRLASYPFPVQGIRMVQDKESIYAFGGFRYSSAFDYSPNWRVDAQGREEVHWSAVSDDEVYRYDMRRDRWQHMTTMPRRRSSNIVHVQGRRVYLIGGWDGTLLKRNNRATPVFHSMVDVFDLDRQEFIPFDVEVPDPVRRAFSAAAFDGKLAMFGGLGRNLAGPPPLLDTVTVFDPATSTFSDSVIPKLPTALFSPGACFTGTKFVVAGGQPTFSTISQKVYTFTLGDALWREAAPLSQPAMFIELHPISADRVLAFGGHGNPNPLGLWEEIAV